MCGIVGFLGRHSDATNVIASMTNTLFHRGPDEQDIYSDSVIHLGHTRLSVIDLNAGTQPLCNEDGSVWIVFNGEIYNFKTLRAELELKGHIFKTNTDTEVIIHGYEEYGEDIVNRLRGMFAFAIWDSKASTLFVARDAFGIKPFYYYLDKDFFVFASELKAVVKHENVKKDIDLDSISLFLERQFIPSPKTIYKDVKKLRPGYAALLKFDNGVELLKEYRYYNIDYSDKLKLNENELVNVVENSLKDSVKSMLVSDVPLGVFLSGGIDSSLIAALTAKELPNKIDTFTIGFYGKDSEHEHADKVAKHINSNQHTLMLAPNDVLAKFDYWSDIFDEPFADQAALPTLLLSEFARKDITVALTGEGADEVFGGYFNYPARLKEEKFTKILGATLSPLPIIAKLLPAIAKKDRVITAMCEPESRRYVTIPNVYDKALFSSIFTKEFMAKRSDVMANYAQAIFHTCNSKHYLDKILHVDLNLWLPDNLLTKVDRASMAYGLEARVPYLDQEFIKVAAQIEPDFKVNGKIGKYILKKIASKHLPQDIVYRHKQGFVMPLSEWLESELKPIAINALDSFAKRGIFKPEALDKIKKEHYGKKRNHSGRIWTILILERWLQNYAPDFKIG